MTALATAQTTAVPAMTALSPALASAGPAMAAAATQMVAAGTAITAGSGQMVAAGASAAAAAAQMVLAGTTMTAAAPQMVAAGAAMTGAAATMLAAANIMAASGGGKEKGIASLFSLVGGFPGFAQHGGLHRGLTVVGEDGPEFVDFRRPGRVYTNETLRQIARGEGAVARQSGRSSMSA